MTREEAIKTLQELWRETNDSWYEEAYDMAIKALQGDMYCPNCGVRLVQEDEYLEPTQTHGRLIDADALMKELSDIQPCNWAESEAEIQEDADYSLFKSLINSAPTVQAYRPHGEWIVNTDDSCGGITLTCSECGEQFNFDDADEVLDFKEHAHFCINCGAKTGGDDK